MLIGGGGEKQTLRYTARHADIWHGFGDAERARAQERRPRRVVPGRGPRPRRDRAVGGRLGGRRGESAPALIEAGTTFFTVGLSGPRYDVAKVNDWIAFRDDHNKSL